MLHFHLGLFSDMYALNLKTQFNFSREVVSHIQMMNADCILHAALEGDRDQVKKRLEHLKMM